MPRKGFTRQLQALEFLSQAQLEAMHRATLDILWETGIRFESDWALDFLNKNGCQVDAEHMRVRFPAALVQECLAQVPKQFQVKAPDPQNELVYGGDTVYFSHSSGMQTIDLDTYRPRPPSRSEYVDCIRTIHLTPGQERDMDKILRGAGEFYAKREQV